MTPNPSPASELWAIVLAAGKGTRMKSDLPKVLAQACGRPLIDYVLDALEQVGVVKTIAVVGYRADDVERSLKGRDNLRFALQTEQRGTGHAVMMCRPLLQNHRGPLIVVTGDSPMLKIESLEKLLAEFHRARAACVMGTLIHPTPAGLGRIVRDNSGQFRGIVEEKDATAEQREIREVNMSTYVFDSQRLVECLDLLTNNNRQGEYYITDVPSILLGKGFEVRALPVLDPSEAFSVNTLEDLAIVEREIQRRQRDECAS
jgi:bifunctional UDP-N-acetylglucosamine pyrophosphorylase/glucosamine-1-phosphate N-acetyltransferase/UDP-N-acetylglucosamine pyrophosphorylase